MNVHIFVVCFPIDIKSFICLACHFLYHKFFTISGMTGVSDCLGPFPDIWKLDKQVMHFLQISHCSFSIDYPVPDLPFGHYRFFHCTNTCHFLGQYNWNTYTSHEVCYQRKVHRICFKNLCSEWQCQRRMPFHLMFDLCRNKLPQQHQPVLSLNRCLFWVLDLPLLRLPAYFCSISHGMK